MKPKNLFNSINCACEGIIHALKTQRHMRIHFISALSAIFLSLYLNISVNDFIIVCILIGIVISSELINTAFEITMDTLKNDFHISVKYIKDICAGAVLLNSTVALFGGIFIFSKYLIKGTPSRISETGYFLGLISLLLVVITVILVKAYFRRGKPLRGGMPSGHAACSFSVFTSIYIIEQNLYLLILMFLLAVVVSLSRFFLGIHKKEEVIFGSLLGSGLTYIIFLLFGR